MEQLNINRINTAAPYKVWRTVHDNQFNFITENGDFDATAAVLCDK